MSDLGWGEDTVGAESQTPEALSSAQFKPLKIPTAKQGGVPAEVTAQHVANATVSWDAASSSQKRQGHRFYPGYHRSAVRVGMGEDPGMLVPHPSGNGVLVRDGSAASRVRSDLRQPVSAVDRVQSADPAETRKAAAKIAILSPSGGGMTWERNAQAAYDIGGLSSEVVAGLREADAAQRMQQHSAGLLKSLKGTDKRPGGGSRAEIKAATTINNAHKADVTRLSAAARAPLAGQNLSRQSIGTIVRAHAVHTGARTPEQALPMKLKTGAFFETGNDPKGSLRAVIDGRSHDINHGEHLLWDTKRGLTAVGRYQHHEGVVQQAASARGVSPSTLQAGSWIADKEHQMRNQSDAARAYGQGASRHGSKPVGQ